MGLDLNLATPGQGDWDRTDDEFIDASQGFVGTDGDDGHFDSVDPERSGRLLPEAASKEGEVQLAGSRGEVQWFAGDRPEGFSAVGMNAAPRSGSQAFARAIRAKKSWREAVDFDFGLDSAEPGLNLKNGRSVHEAVGDGDFDLRGRDGEDPGRVSFARLVRESCADKFDF